MVHRHDTANTVGHVPVLVVHFGASRRRYNFETLVVAWHTDQIDSLASDWSIAVAAVVVVAVVVEHLDRILEMQNVQFVTHFFAIRLQCFLRHFGTVELQ